jgi:hypothetical protein
MRIVNRHLPWTNEATTYMKEHERQKRNTKSGVALKTHTASAHGGKVQADCPACIEIQRKQKELNQ